VLNTRDTSEGKKKSQKQISTTITLEAMCVGRTSGLLASG